MTSSECRSIVCLSLITEFLIVFMKVLSSTLQLPARVTHSLPDMLDNTQGSVHAPPEHSTDRLPKGSHLTEGLQDEVSSLLGKVGRADMLLVHDVLICLCPSGTLKRRLARKALKCQNAHGPSVYSRCVAKDSFVLVFLRAALLRTGQHLQHCRFSGMPEHALNSASDAVAQCRM